MDPMDVIMFEMGVDGEDDALEDGVASRQDWWDARLAVLSLLEALFNVLPAAAADAAGSFRASKLLLKLMVEREARPLTSRIFLQAVKVRGYSQARFFDAVCTSLCC